MHAEAMAYLQAARERLGDDISALRVLEIGSYNVNGSPREVFGEAKTYIGLDRQEGPDVDLVGDAETYSVKGAERFDLIISCEALEHTPDPAAIIYRSLLNLKRGGHLLLTAAAPPRLPHSWNGAARLGAGEYYTNIDPGWLEQMLKSAGFTVRDLQYDRERGDVYVLAQRPSNTVTQ